MDCPLENRMVEEGLVSILLKQVVVSKPIMLYNTEHILTITGRREHVAEISLKLREVHATELWRNKVLIF